MQNRHGLESKYIFTLFDTLQSTRISNAMRINFVESSLLN
jgi:hypothetical protein